MLIKYILQLHKPFSGKQMKKGSFNSFSLYRMEIRDLDILY